MLRRQLPASAASIRTARMLVVALAEEMCDISDQVAADLELCISEAATSLIQHVDHQATEQPMMELRVCHRGQDLVIEMNAGSRPAFLPGPGLSIINTLTSGRATATGDGTRLTMSFPCRPVAAP